MGSDLFSCFSWLALLVLLVGVLLAWSITSAERENKRKSEEIVRWAQEKQQEREEGDEVEAIRDLWYDITSWFPYLPDPESASHDPDDLKRAVVHRLRSVPTLGTFSRADLPAPSLPPEERRRHLYVVGKTGSGKTTFLEHLMLRDLRAGHGMGVMAPEGELFRGRLLPLIPPERRPEVIYFAPGDPSCPVTFNPLQIEPGDDAFRASEDLFTIFRRVLPGDALGPRMQPILQNAFAVLVGRPGATLWDVKRLLTDATFRRRVVETTEDEYIREFWETTFPRFAKSSDLPLLSRLDHFLRPQAIRRTLCHPMSSFSIRQALQDRRILFFDLFGLSEETRSLIGQMLLSKFQLELMRRELSGGAPPTFYLYCDEFQTFAGFAEGVWRELLSRGRKYGLALTLAHQFPAQLPGALQEEIFGNVNSMISFGLGNKDAQVVRKEFLTTVVHKNEARVEPLPVEALLELGRGEAYAKLAGGRAVRLSMPEPLRVEDPEATGKTIQTSWYVYGAPQGLAEEVVEEEATPQDPTPEPKVTAPPPPREEERRAPEPPKPQQKERKKPQAPPAPLGRGGPEHQYLQELVKRLGESRGFRVTIEKQVLDGAGSVDVALEREGWRVACEISVTTSVEHEVGNVEKCLQAGFDEVLWISSNKRQLGKLGRALQKRLDEGELAKVRLCDPEEASSYLVSLPMPQEKVETVGGYTVKVTYQPTPASGGQTRTKAVAGVIARSLKRLQRTQE